MAKYQYTGENEVQIPNVGVVKPNEVIETKAKIEHPLFVKVEKVAKEVIKTDKK